MPSIVRHAAPSSNPNKDATTSLSSMDSFHVVVVPRLRSLNVISDTEKSTENDFIPRCHGMQLYDPCENLKEP
jgi:hypothetical protein